MEKNCRSTHLELVGPIWTFTHTEKNYMDTGVELVGLTCTLTHTAKSYNFSDTFIHICEFVGDVMMYGHVSRSSGPAKTILQGTVRG